MRNHKPLDEVHGGHECVPTTIFQKAIFKFPESKVLRRNADYLSCLNETRLSAQVSDCVVSGSDSFQRFGLLPTILWVVDLEARRSLFRSYRHAHTRFRVNACDDKPNFGIRQMRSAGALAELSCVFKHLAKQTICAINWRICGPLFQTIKADKLTDSLNDPRLPCFRAEKVIRQTGVGIDRTFEIRKQMV